MLKYQVKSRVAYITLNRPEKRNAFSQELVLELKKAFTKAEKDENVKVIVFDAVGKVFCAGADLGYLQSLQSNSFEENLEDSSILKSLYEQIYKHPKIVIAQVQGHAIAGGCGLMTVCDFAFTVPHAKFGYTEVKIGFVPAIVMVFLLRKIGEARAKKLLLSGDLISAEEAIEMGIVTKIVEAEKLKQHVFDFAQHLCKTNSAQSMTLTKQMIAQVQEQNLSDGLQYAAQMNAKARAMDDCKAGIQAFLTKEKIVW